MNDRITVEGHEGAFAAYVARPKTVPAPAVIVLQELFGVNADIRKHCDELAEQGFLAVAPDLFWRQEPGVDLTVTSEADWQHGLRLYGAYDRDAGAKDVKDTVNAVRNLPECNGKVALLGYCLGALIVFLTAVRCHGVDAAVAYHGADTEKYLGEVDGLNAPLLMHLAEEDEFISKAAQAEIKAALAKKPNATVYSYPGQNRWKTTRQIPARSLESEKLSKDLKPRGFNFVGPTVAYAYMQAIGMWNCLSMAVLPRSSGSRPKPS